MDFQRIVAEACRVPGGLLCTETHPEDDMLVFARGRGRSEDDVLMTYFTVGVLTASVLERVLVWLGRSWAQLDGTLDFASGFGRLTRFLVQVMPPDNLWVSDILTPAVEFQRQTFGVHAFASTGVAADLNLPRSYELISAISLFTHLPELAFRPWLETLARALRPGGVLVFTCHGSEHFEAVHGRELDGFHFKPISESRVLSPDAYGTAHCSRDWVGDRVAAMDGVELLAAVPRGLDQQDLYVVGRQVDRPAHPLTLHALPDGAIESAGSEPGGDAFVAGWALDDGYQPVRRVTVLLDDRTVGDAVLGVSRPDLRQTFGDACSADGGWVLRGGVPRSMPQRVTVAIEDRHGMRVLRSRTLAEILGGS